MKCQTCGQHYFPSKLPSYAVSDRQFRTPDACINLTPKEARIVSLLLHHYPETVEYEAISTQPSRILSVYVTQLRRLLESFDLPLRIRTRRGYGWYLEVVK